MKNKKFPLISTPLIVIIFSLLFIQPREIFPQFAYGADVSWLSQMEYWGYVFKDNSGNQKDCLDILKSKGINALRFRIWVNPANDFNNKKDVVYMASRAKSKGFDVMIDFHMSDNWADPGKQAKPAAWAAHSITQLQTDVYNHVYNVLDTLKKIGVIPKWIQIGNETNNGMLWEEGKASVSMGNFAALVKSGYNAAKAVDNSIQVVVHLSNGHDNSLYRWMFDGLKNNGAKWDVIGMSVYPKWANLPWATDNSLALTNMQDMIARYNTKVIVCEAGYQYDQAVEARNYLADLLTKTKSIGGLGVFYWEPQSYNWQNYSLGAWDPVTKQPTIAMDAFKEANPVAVKYEKIAAKYSFDVYPNPFNPSTIITFQLPSYGYVSLKVYDMIGREVATIVDENKQSGVYSYQLSTNTFQWPSGIYFCRMISQNYAETKKIVLMK